MSPVVGNVDNRIVNAVDTNVYTGVMIRHLRTSPLSLVGYLLVAVATALSVLLAQSSVLRAWNSNSLAIGSHAAANAFWASHDVDAQGNTVTVFQISNSMNTVDVEPGSGTTSLTSSGSVDSVVSKFDSSGVLLWTFQIKGGDSNNSEVSSRAITTDSAGNVYIAGKFIRAVDFDGSVGNTAGDFVSNQSGGSYVDDGFILKLDSNGQFQWVTRTQSGSAYFGMNSIDLDASGNIYVTGDYTGDVDLDYDGVTTDIDLQDPNGAMYIAKYGTNGRLMWKYTAAAGSGDITVSGTRVLMAGTFGGGPIDFDPTAGTDTLTAGGFIDAYIVELDTSGVYQDVHHIKGGLFGDQASAPRVRFASDGSIIVSGYYFGVSTASGSGINFSPPNAGAFKAFVGAYQAGNGFVAKYSSTFSFQWASMFVPAAPLASTPQQRVDIYALDATDDGGAVIGGVYNGKVDLDPSGTTDARTSVPASPDMDAFVMKINSSGAREWVNVLSSSSAKLVNNVVFRLGHITAYGGFGGTLDFDPSASTYNVTATRSNDNFMWRVDRAGTSAPATLPSGGGSTTTTSTVVTTTTVAGGTGSSPTGNASGYPTTNEVSSFKATELVTGGEAVAGRGYLVSAAGFTPSETVNAYLLGTSTSIGTDTASASGSARMSIKIPSGAKGTKTLVLVGKTSRYGVRQSLSITPQSSALPVTGRNIDMMWWGLAVLMSGGLIIGSRRRSCRHATPRP